MTELRIADIEIFRMCRYPELYLTFNQLGLPVYLEGIDRQVIPLKQGEREVARPRLSSAPTGEDPKISARGARK